MVRLKAIALTALMMGHLTLYARAADYSCQALADDGTFIPIHFVGVDPKAGTGKALLEVGKPLTVSIKEDHELLILKVRVPRSTAVPSTIG